MKFIIRSGPRHQPAKFAWTSEPLITVWLQVRVLPSPPARETSEGCRAGAQRATAGAGVASYGSGKPGRVKRPHQKRVTSLFIAIFQQSANY
jgi:hypothetical protein